jgi:hypothetical protein
MLIKPLRRSVAVTGTFSFRCRRTSFETETDGAMGKTNLVISIDKPCYSLLCNIFECTAKLIQKDYVDLAGQLLRGLVQQLNDLLRHQ